MSASYELRGDSARAGLAGLAGPAMLASSGPAAPHGPTVRATERRSTGRVLQHGRLTGDVIVVPAQQQFGLVRPGRGGAAGAPGRRRRPATSSAGRGGDSA